MIRVLRLLATSVALSLFTTSSAFAYCLTTTCAQDDPKPAECNPGVKQGTCQMAGETLFWEKSCSSYSVQIDGSAKLGITASQLEAVARQAFKNWLDVDCPEGGKPNFVMETYPQVECDEVRYNKTARNQNVWVFRDEPSLDLSVIGLTSVIFAPDSGQIYDVDMEFNSNQYDFYVGNGTGEFALEAVVQHEAGHVLGLAHSDAPQSTMLDGYDPNVDMSTLDTDDIEGICAARPPVEKADTNCDAEPRHGFSTQCNEPMDSGGCSCTVLGRPNNHRNVALLFAALGLLLVRSKSKGRAKRC